MSGKRAWGGRFGGETDARVEAFTESVSYDRALYRHDIAGSIAHAAMMRKAGLLTGQEADEIIRGLREILAEMDAGRFGFRSEDEDIHMNVERALQDKLGDLAGKLHTARSRNDQVALDLRMWTREEIDRTSAGIRAVQEALVDLADRFSDAVMPGYTHLQRAQPVTCGHWILAYVEMLQRDAERLSDCRGRANVLPLGSCALAGTSLPIDRSETAKLLGFDKVSRNSMDAVSDRDFLLEYAFCLACAAVHLSRLSADMIMMAMTEFGFVRISDAFCTGSSLMPHKKNPDVLELIRGKCGRVVGALNALLVMMKGLPLAYNRDMQEDKEPIFDASRQVNACLAVLGPLLRNVTFDEAAMRKACARGFLDATSLAEHLVRLGIPFRKAHHVVGQLVRMAEARGCELSDLPDEEMREVHALLKSDARQALGAEGVVRSYLSSGSANPKLVRREIEEWKVRLAGRRPPGPAKGRKKKP